MIEFLPPMHTGTWVHEGRVHLIFKEPQPLDDEPYMKRLNEYLKEVYKVNDTDIDWRDEQECWLWLDNNDEVDG